MLFILSLGFIFTIMINFCMKSVHALLSFSKDNREVLIDKPIFHDPSIIPSPAAGGLGFFTFSGDINQPTNAAATASLPASSSSPSPGGGTSVADAVVRKDPGGIGFLDEIGGSVDGLMSCTESLGFESSDERRVDGVADPIEGINNAGSSRTTTSADRTKSTRTAVKKSGGDEVVKKFPPPISLLSQTGKPTFFLRPVRKDGRLELTEVKIAHREILQASREDGRLRLSLVRDIDMDDQDQADNPEEIFEDTDEKEDEEEEKAEGEEEETGQLFPVTNGGGDRQWRCHELMSRPRRHHNLHHEWSQPCVTIR